MNPKQFTAILQVALWKNEGMSEIEIRQLLANLVSDEIIKSGIKLTDYLNSIEIKWTPKHFQKIALSVEFTQIIK